MNKVVTGPNDAASTYRAGRAATVAGDRAAAEALFLQTVQHDARHDGALRHLLQFAEAKGDQELALQYLDRIVAVAPDDIPMRLRRARLLLRLSRTAEAEEALRRLANVHSNTAAAHLELAALLQRLNRNDEAQDVLRIATHFVPDEGLVWHKLGKLLAASKRHQEAAATLGVAARLLPDSVPVHIDLIDALQEAGEPATAKKAATLAIERCPDVAKLHLLRAELNVALGEKVAAATDYRRAFDLDPTHRPTALTLATLQEAARDRKGAAETLRIAAEAKPDDIGIAYRLAMLLVRSGRFAEAEQYLRRVVALDPNNAGAWRQLAVALRRQDRHEEAVALFPTVVTAVRRALPATFIDGLRAVEQRMGLPLSPASRLDQGLFPDRRRWPAATRHLWGRHTIDLVNSWSLFRRDRMVEVDRFTEPMSFARLKKGSGEIGGGVLVSAHFGVGYHALCAMAQSGLPHRIVARTDEVLLSYQDVAINALARDNHTALARLSTFLKTEGGLIFTAGDGGVGRSARNLEYEGYKVRLVSGPPTLAFLAQSRIYFFASLFGEEKIKLVLNQGPGFPKKSDMQSWTETWLDFFSAQYIDVLRSSPENLGVGAFAALAHTFPSPG